jgi:hypothetical protein
MKRHTVYTVPVAKLFFTEAEFLDAHGTKVLGVFLLIIWIYPPPPPSKSGLKLVCKVNNVYGNLKSESSQDYIKKPQRNCTFMNLASVLIYLRP